MSTETPEFHTNSLFLAAWLLCGRAPYHQHKVSFLRVQWKSPNSRAKLFCFADPEGEGAAIEEEFAKNPPVRVITLKNAYHFLQDRMRELEQERQNGGAK